MSRSQRKSSASFGGFTIIELIMTIVILSILAAEVLPRFANQQTFDARGFADQTRAAIQYGRKLAIATGHNVCVSASGSTLTLTSANGRGRGAACPNPVMNPANGDDYEISSPETNVYYSNSLALKFHADGTPTLAGTLTIHGDSDITIQIDGTTGYVK